MTAFMHSQLRIEVVQRLGNTRTLANYFLTDHPARSEKEFAPLLQALKSICDHYDFVEQQLPPRSSGQSDVLLQPADLQRLRSTFIERASKILDSVNANQRHVLKLPSDDFSSPKEQQKWQRHWEQMGQAAQAFINWTNEHLPENT